MRLSIDKKILLISYHFAPSSAVGGLRIEGFAKHLPSYGWDPCVLTMPEKNSQGLDYERLRNLKGLRILRTGKLPGALETYLKLKAVYSSLLQRKKISVADLERAYEMARPNSIEPSKSAAHRLKTFLFSFLTLPDSERNWILPAFLAAFQEIRRSGIRVVLTSSPPHSVQLIGLLLKKLCGVAWIADFRDPWLRPLGKSNSPISRLSLIFENMLEKMVLCSADRVIITNEMLAEALRRSYLSCDPYKFISIPNGYDPELDAFSKGVQKYETFTITHAGTLYLGRTPEPLFSAVRELIYEKKVERKDIRIKLLGNSDILNGKTMGQVVSDYDLTDIVELSGRVSYPQALKTISKSHLALLLAPEQPYQIPAKTYDYIGCRTPILAIANCGATSHLVQSTETGKVCRPEAIEEIKTFLYDSFQSRSMAPGYEKTFASRYSRKKLAGALAEVLDKAGAEV